MRRCLNLLGLLWQKERKESWWSVDLEGEMEKLKVVGPWSGTEGGSVDPKGGGPQVGPDKGKKRGKGEVEGR